MTTIVAKTKYAEFEGFKGYLRVIITIFLGASLSLLSYFFFENLLALFTLLFCSVLVLLVIMAPSQEIKITLAAEGIYFDNDLLPWQICHSWVMVDLDNMVEFVIQTTKFESTYYYFYVDSEQESIKDFITSLSQILPYNEAIEDANLFHKIVRLLGLG